MCSEWGVRVGWKWLLPSPPLAARLPIHSTLNRQLPKANLRQIHGKYASRFVKPYSSRLLQISTMFNCRFKVQNPRLVSLPRFVS